MEGQSQASRDAEGGEMQAKTGLAIPEPQTHPATKASAEEAGSHPLWALDDAALDDVPDEVKGAIDDVVRPAYLRFVVETHDPIERSLGMTLVHLMWLEVLQQHHAQTEYRTFNCMLGLPDGGYEQMNQQLRLLQGKVRLGQFLVKLQEARERSEARRSAGSDHPRECLPAAKTEMEPEDEPQDEDEAPFAVNASIRPPLDAVIERREARRPEPEEG